MPLYVATGIQGDLPLLAATPVVLSYGPTGIWYFRFDNSANAAITYVQIFSNTQLNNISVGQTLPFDVVPIPANGFWSDCFAHASAYPLPFGLAIAATTTRGGGVAPTTGIAATISYR